MVLFLGLLELFTKAGLLGIRRRFGRVFVGSRGLRASDKMTLLLVSPASLQPHFTLQKGHLKDPKRVKPDFSTHNSV